VAGGEFEFFLGGGLREGQGGRGVRGDGATAQQTQNGSESGGALLVGGGGGADQNLLGPLRGTRPFGTPSGAPGTASLGIPTELRPGDPLGSPGAGSPWGRPGYSPVGIPRAREARGALGE
jgi:hypothetical protein